MKTGPTRTLIHLHTMLRRTLAALALTICSVVPALGADIFVEPFANNSAGWSLDTGWGIGSATVSISQTQLGPDPGIDHTATADNGIAGYVIGGSTGTALFAARYITSPVINTNVPGSVYLEFWRWLNSDYPNYMYSTVEVWNGASWVVLFTAPSPGVQDSAWTQITYDVTAHKNPAFRVRFGVSIDSGGVWDVSSWNIDDVRVYDAAAAGPEIAVEQPVGTNIPDGGTKNFGSVNLGSSTSLQFTIKNTGNSNLTGLTITKDGANPGDFTITASPTAPVSGPSGSTTFTVQFAPAAAGARSAAIHIANNDSDENPFDINLTGTGVNNPPTVTRNLASVTVSEGSPAANTGTFSDSNGNATVTLSANVGAVIKNDGAGTWSWSYTPADGPTASTTVIISANDGFNPPVTTNFSLTVNNVAPAYDLGLPDPEFLTPGSGVFARGPVSFTDPGADSWSGTVNYGDGTGTGPLSVNGGAKTFALSHTYTLGGLYTVSTNLSDDDGGSQPDTMQVDVILEPILVTGAASAISAYKATLNGTVNPNHGTTTVRFEYSTDPTLSSGVMQTPVQNVGSGTSALPVSANIVNLLADTRYYFRLIGENVAGSSQGGIVAFESSYPVASDEYYDASDGLAGGGEIYRPTPGVINEAGRISFKAYGTVGSGSFTTSNDQILMTDTTGNMRVVGREGTPVPPAGSLSGLFSNLLLTDGGQTQATDKLIGAPKESDYIYLLSPDGSGLEVLNREGDTAPGGGVFLYNTSKPAADHMERIYFQGTLSGVSSKQNSGVWYDDGAALEELVREGDVAPTGAGPALQAWYGNVLAKNSAAGDGAAFISYLQHNPDDSSQKTDTALNQGVFSGAPGGVALVARKGDVIPGVGAIDNFSGVSRGSSGDHAFISMLKRSATAPVVTTADDQVLLAEVAGVIYLVAREQTTDLTAGLTPKRFDDFYMTSDGTLIFQAWLTGPGVTTGNDSVLCRWTVGGGLELMAREGSAAAGTGSSYGVFQTLSVSPGGAVALQSRLSNGLVTLMRAYPGGALAPVVQTTDPITFKGLPRTILSLGIHKTGAGSGGGGGGMGAAINDAGDVFTVVSLGGGDYVGRIYRGSP